MKIAIVGASNNIEKYGNKIVKDLVSKGYTVFPVNPKEEKIEGIKAYSSLKDIKANFDIANFVTKPEITFNILKNNLDLLKAKKIWCQPGASDQKVKKFLSDNNFDYITDSCIMLNKISHSS